MIVAGGLEPLHRQTMSVLLPALSGSFCPSSLTSNGRRYISTATRTIKGGDWALLLTSQLCTASRWDRISFSILRTLCDFRRSGKYWVSLAIDFPSRFHVTRGKGFPPLAKQVSVTLAPSAYADVSSFFTGPVSSLICTPWGGTVKTHKKKEVTLTERKVS